MDLGFTLIHYGLFLISHICKDPLSKYSQTPKFWVGMNRGWGCGALFNPVHLLIRYCRLRCQKHISGSVECPAHETHSGSVALGISPPLPSCLLFLPFSYRARVCLYYADLEALELCLVPAYWQLWLMLKRESHTWNSVFLGAGAGEGNEAAQILEPCGYFSWGPWGRLCWPVELNDLRLPYPALL